MQRFLLACGLAALAIVARASGVALAQTSDNDLLRLICDPRYIKDDQCTRAKGYPGGKACNVDLDTTRGEGHYLSANSTLLVVVYRSECEPHATNFGGLVIFEKRGKSFVFKAYQPGLVFSDCVTIPRRTGQDRLICTTDYMGQGHQESTVSEAVFTQDFSKNIKADLDVVVTASDDTGAYGANRVECKETFRLFDFSSPKAGPAPNTVRVEARYADASVIRKACAPGATPPKDVTEPAPAGEAYIEDGDIRKGNFVIDLATRKITPESGPGAR